MKYAYCEWCEKYIETPRYHYDSSVNWHEWYCGCGEEVDWLEDYELVLKYKGRENVPELIEDLRIEMVETGMLEESDI